MIFYNNLRILSNYCYYKIQEVFSRVFLHFFVYIFQFSHAFQFNIKLQLNMNKRTNEAQNTRHKTIDKIKQQQKATMNCQN